MARVLPMVWLVAVWVALWGDLSAANVASGVAVGAVLVGLFPPASRRRSTRLRPVAAARFATWFAWKLVEASAVVAWEVVTPRTRINEGIVAVPIRGVSDGVITLVANAISLTPGSLTLEVRRRPAVLYVHVLHLHDIEAVRREIRHLEVLAIRAFGPLEAARAVASGDDVPLGDATASSQSGPRRGEDDR
ncbi:MAG: Na+/H+ antiporter subunit E [Acidimicrobiales bacterium]